MELSLSTVTPVVTESIQIVLDSHKLEKIYYRNQSHLMTTVMNDGSWGELNNYTVTGYIDQNHSGTMMVNTGNNSSNDTGIHRIVTLILYLSTFVVGFFGNALVIFVILRFSDVRMKSVANYYILNLAFADVVFLLTLPLFCYATFNGNWVFGNPMCKISYIFREINKFGSIFTLMALSVDRFLASFHELSFLRTIRAGKIVCLSVWIASVAMCMPFFLYSYSVSYDSKSVCRINWPTKNRLYHMRLWTYSQFTLGLIIPIVVITLSYLLLMYRLKEIMALRQTHRTKRPNKKLTRTILIVVVIFLICHVPYYTMDIISLHKSELAMRYVQRGEVYSPSKTELTVFIYCQALAQMLVFISSSCNPIIYGITNDNFREYFCYTFHCSLILNL